MGIGGRHRRLRRRRSTHVYDEANEENVTDFLAFSTDNPSSIRNCFEAARTNARAVRTALTVEMWDAINGAWLELKRSATGRPRARSSRASCAGCRSLAAVRRLGLPHHAAQRRLLVLAARRLSSSAPTTPRASSTSNITCCCRRSEHVGGPLDYFQWAAILRSVSALTAYHWVYRDSLKPWLIADLLILNDQMPRSLASCYENLVRNLDRIARAYGRQGPAQRHARAIRTRLENSRMDEIFQRGLHEFIGEFIADNNRLGGADHRAISDVNAPAVSRVDIRCQSWMMPSCASASRTRPSTTTTRRRTA